MACCASDSAITSACADEQLPRTTRLTPIDTSRPVASSNTAAANGPPVSRSKFVRESSITQRMRSSSSNSTGARGERLARPVGEAQLELSVATARIRLYELSLCSSSGRCSKNEKARA